MTDIDKSAIDSLSVAPGGGEDEAAFVDDRQSAGQDKSIARRLEKNPESPDARLDNALDESMDASDPPASTQPVHSSEPPASSGYDPAAEGKRRGA
jgi:hypothetical protein